jgi:hypothetical protein
MSCPTRGWCGGAAIDVEHADGRDALRLGAPEHPSSDERFEGVLGFVAERAGGSRVYGSGVRQWISGGAAVEYDEIENELIA